MRTQWLLMAAPLLAAGPPPAGAVDTPVSQARADEAHLAADSVAAAARLREAETAADAADQQVERLSERRRAAADRLRAQAAALAPFLPLVERLGLFPAETLLAAPAPPGQAVRGVMVMRGLTRSLERQARELRTELAELDDAQRALEQALPALHEAQRQQALLAAQLDRQLAAARTLRSRLEDAAAEQARRAAIEASHADTVRDALGVMAASRARSELLLEQDADRAIRQRRDAALDTTRRRQAQLAEPPGPGLRPGAGTILPVAGRIVRRWGEPTDAGPANGIALQAPPNARVVSPCSGRVVFAQPFRSYGNLLILDCGGGFHFVLAGFGRFDSEAGDHVQPGEPLGVMPDWDPTADTRRPALYVEVRRDGQPVDPAPFLRPSS